MIQSMSRISKCIDNGPMEGVWGTIKSEIFRGNKHFKFNSVLFFSLIMKELH
ncbi:insertion element protein [Staphylococcus aureus]|nr:insertion element protein [Staphylococcus aureus]